MSGTRVLWLTTGSGHGGAGTLLVGLARAMHRRDVAIEVGFRHPETTALVDALDGLDVPTHLLGGGAAWPWRLRRLLRERRYDVVHSHAPLVGTAARLVAPARTVLLHTEHTSWDRYHPATRAVNAATLARNERVWAASEQVAESVHLPRPLPRPTVEVMLHGVDPATVRRGPGARTAARTLLGIPDDAFVFGSVGDLAVKKDQITMIRAFASVHRQLSRSRLVLVGTGPREAYLRSLAAQLGVRDAVHFLGERGDVLDVLPAFDVFVLSSLHEGLSTAVIEALASEIPVVATRVGGIPRLIAEGEHGLLVRPRDVEALAAAMLRLALDDAERARLAAAGPVRADQFGIRAAADALVEHYRRLSGHRDAARSIR